MPPTSSSRTTTAMSFTSELGPGKPGLGCGVPGYTTDVWGSKTSSKVTPRNSKPNCSMAAVQCAAVKKTSGAIKVPEQNKNSPSSSATTNAPTLGCLLPSGC